MLNEEKYDFSKETKIREKLHDDCLKLEEELHKKKSQNARKSVTLDELENKKKSVTKIDKNKDKEREIKMDREK